MYEAKNPSCRIFVTGRRGMTSLPLTILLMADSGFADA